MRQKKLDNEPQGILARIRQSIWREPRPQDDHGRARLVLNDLILHLHPTKISRRALKITYSFGLGGLSILLFLTLGITGILLLFVYTPTPDAAYTSVQNIETSIWMGQLVRNVHHWSGNLLLILVVLHLLRVFFTAAFHAPREFNWILGLCLLALVALSNFTGYLMPWDQLAYWATTIAASMLSYVPVVGQGIHNWLLGGAEIGAVTLRTFFAFHIVVFPLLMVILISYHIWRVRKDTFSLPRQLNEPPLEPRKLERVTTIPYLVNIEIAAGLALLVLMVAWSTFVDAPLKGPANPNLPPNPAKAAWYFMGFQELLLHLHPAFVTFVIPGLTALGLLLLPYLDYTPGKDQNTIGIWFRSAQGRGLVTISGLIGVVTTVILVVVDEYWLNLPQLLDFLPVYISNGFIPLSVVLAALAGYYWILHRRGFTTSEKNMAIFSLLFASFITLTVIGVFFRGENMKLVLPWKM